MTNLTTKTIALALQESVALRFSILQGVQDVARTRSDWHLVRSGDSLVLTWEEALAAKPDGIIGFVGQKNMPALQGIEIPVVCVNSIHNMPEFVRVRSDAHAVGTLAAQYFLEHGYSRFAFCTDVPTHYYSQLRWEGFRDTLQLQELSAQSIEISNANGFEQLKTLAPGCAVYCATDSCARRVLTYCEDASILVPQQLAVLGTDNDPFYCEGGKTLLSSIDVNHRKIGAKAAEMLGQILDGADAPAEAVLIPPVKVITRLT